MVTKSRRKDEYLGKPVFHGWEAVPAGFYTKTQLKADRLQIPDTASPDAYKRGGGNYLALYRRESSVPMPPKRGSDYASLFENRYTSKRAAYRDASNALFELNRYAKDEFCTERHKAQIYRLKNAWIKHLYEQGFCIEAQQARTPETVLPSTEKECWCTWGGCERCDDTGVYTLPEKKVGGKLYWSFRFEVDGQRFAWHQPAHGISYLVSPIGNPAKSHDVLAEEKPVSLAPKKFAEAKALIAWCLEE